MSIMDTLKQADPQVAEAIDHELNRQRTKLELIASENIVSRAVMEAQGSVLTNKYAEGYPGKRYYGGCEYVDVAEQLAIDRAKELFGAAWANVQPHSGAQANMAVFFSLLSPGDTYMGMNLTDGGHLTHGSPVNISGTYYKVIPYGVDRETERIDYDALEKLAAEHHPRMIIAGASAYARIIDFERIAAIAKSVDAIFMVDMAHIAGLVAAGQHPSPVPYADIVTTTTHKTLRGPRGGVILCRDNTHEKALNSAIFPSLQGGPLMHVIAAKAVAFKEALQPEFKQYAKQVRINAAAMAEELVKRGLRIVSGRTESHVFLVDLQPMKITGKAAEAALGKANITVNKNAIPNDPEKPFVTSGIRIGSAAMTTRGFNEADARVLANLVADVLANPEDEANLANVRKQITALCDKYPVYGA